MRRKRNEVSLIAFLFWPEGGGDVSVEQTLILKRPLFTTCPGPNFAPHFLELVEPTLI